jgi:hypothetical protein
MVRYQFTTAISECAEITIPSGYVAGVDDVGKFNVFDTKVTEIVRRFVEYSIAIPVLLNHPSA